MWKIYGNLFYWFCLCYSPVSGAPIDDEYNLQDHSDLYILDLGKQGFNLNKLWVFLLNPVLRTLEKELLRFQAGLVSRLDQNSVLISNNIVVGHRIKYHNII